MNMLKSFKLGDIKIKAPVFLAPMSGISDLPFRRLVKSFGVELVFSEMIASREMFLKNDSKHASESYEEEFPIAVQLAGCEPDIMAKAARMNVERGASIIDINFGCPVKKVVKKYAGSALMQDEDLATQIMAETVKAVGVPVTVKMRLGWDTNHQNAPSLAKKAQDVGVQMVTVHGRTRDQMYKGQADWQAIKRVRDAIDLPLIVNGDIDSPEQAKEAMKQSGADGVMIGRATCGRPWLLRQTIEYLQEEEVSVQPTPQEILKLVFDHYDAILTYYSMPKGIGIARKHLAWYCEQLNIDKSVIAEINKQKDPECVKELLSHYIV